MGRRCFRLAGASFDRGSRKEGNVTCETLLNLCNGKAVELSVDEGASVVVQAGKPPVVDDVLEERMRVGCGSATIGMFAKQWFGKVDEVVVVDDHITGVLSNIRRQAVGSAGDRHQDEGPKIDSGLISRWPSRARRGVAQIEDPLSILQPSVGSSHGPASGC